MKLPTIKLRLIDFGLIFLLLASIEAKSKSFGGKYAHDGQFPFVALLSFDGRKICGASIFHERWAITAAHCLHDEKDNHLITVGTIQDLGSGTAYKVEKLYVHPDYTLLPEEMNNGLEYVVDDIGLIRLSSKVVFNDKVQPIRLSLMGGSHYKNYTATLVGWGSETFTGFMHKHLRYINVRVLGLDECNKIWTYADKHICTSTQEHQGACYGDSGSPLVVEGIQIGLLSTVDKFCESMKPDLFTNVGNYIPWVQNILSIHGDELTVS